MAIFDFIIIGGGTSGLVVANRLSENPETKVLVLEAGDNYLENQFVNLPAGWPTLLETGKDWDFTTAPQKGLNDRVMTLPQGKALGGSSAINSCVFTIPSQASINAWASLGNVGWDWKTLAPYFYKSHTLHKPSDADVEQLGLYNKLSTEGKSSGPIQVSFPSDLNSPFQKAWNETFDKLGYGFKGNIDNGTAVGAYSPPAAIDPTTKTRSYAAKTYYEPVKERTNLTVVTGAAVTKILFEGESPKLVAIGVEFAHEKTLKSYKASKEVIVAAGAIQSPKVLELSGIGSPNILESYGIPVRVANANVGENLQDPIISGVSFEVADGIETIDGLGRGEPEALGKAMNEYMTTQSGPFGRAAVNSTSILPVNELQTENGREEIHKLLNTAHPAAPTDPAYHKVVRPLIEDPEQGSGLLFMYSAQANFGANSAKGLALAEMPENFVTVSAMLLNPLSTGHVHISSANPDDMPALDFKYLTHPLDADLMARHIQLLDKITTTEPFVSLLKPNGKRNKMYAPWKGLEDVKQYIRKTALSNWHPVATCSMLPKENGGVVGTDLVVYGVKNLRVVDASIMPLSPRSNIQSAVYAVAERAADIIKSAYQ
ncbi:Dehydrogenase [Lachnellula occidentalis]|uniref:Dehydrogenase n=1 Tax=Lachnellula occidentalis TaxID=215460 RepID=A0A8H8RSC9_9HELO|nr:Dehydrogenase [Lachnellula occidentalis]